MTLYCGTHNWLCADTIGHNWLCVQKVLNHCLNHGFFLSLFKQPALPRHIKVWVSFELFGAFYIYIFEPHLNSFQYPLINYLNTDSNENRFYLCYLLQKTKPKRGIGNKWFVSFQDYPQEFYPDYCCGWAYVTNIPTIKSILGT